MTLQLISTVLENIFNNIILLKTLLKKQMDKKSLIKFKNLSCLGFGLMLVCLAGIFTASSYYEEEITSLINSSALLKDYDFRIWGAQPNQENSEMYLKITPYNLSYDNGKTKSELIKDYSVQLDYTYEYTNVSLAQGISGKLSFLNNWQIKAGKNESAKLLTINTINPSAEKIFYYDYYATKTRSMTLMYNLMLKSVSESFMLRLYSQSIFDFYFKNKNEVINDVLTRIGISTQAAGKVYDDSLLGLKTPALLEKWISLSLSEQRSVHQNYDQIRARFQLNQRQMEFLLGPYSTISHMIQAVKGSIRSKMYQKTYNYECEQQHCSAAQVLASQLGANILTSYALLGDFSYKADSIKDVNSTFFSEIEYSIFCRSNQMKCLDDLSVMPFFAENYFGNFTIVEFIYQNIDNMEYLEDFLAIGRGTGDSIVKYMEYLYSKVFDPQQLFKKLYTKFTYAQKAIDRFSEVLNIGLFSNALFNSFILKNKKSCLDYFQGGLAKYAEKACAQTSIFNFKTLRSVQKHMQNYFYPQRRNQIRVQLNMSSQQSFEFYRSSNSPFSVQIQKIRSDFIDHYQCTHQCSQLQLLAREWGSQQILTNLPITYFQEKKASVCLWDTKNLLNGFEPQFTKVIEKTQKIQFAKALQMLIPSNPNSISNFYNILKSSESWLLYIQKTVFSVVFGGIASKRNFNEIFSGYKDQLIQQKIQRQVQSGGTPWISAQVSMIKLSNSQLTQFADQIQIFDQMNTGIYDSERVRSVSSVYGSNISKIFYTVLADQQYPQNNVITQMSTDKQVKGNNILGFHPNIQEGENLKIYFPLAYSAFTLVQKSCSSQHNGFEVFQYGFSMNQIQKTIDISLDSQNSYQIKISEYSKLFIDRKTGLTIASSVKYTTFFNPFYAQTFTSSDQIPLFETEMIFEKGNMSKIQLLNSYEGKKTMIQIIFVGLASLFLALGIAMIVLYMISKRKFGKKNSLLESGQDLENQSSFEANQI